MTHHLSLLFIVIGALGMTPDEKGTQMDNKIACTTGGYGNCDLDRVLLGLATAGFGYVELGVTPSAKRRISPEQMDAAAIRDFQAKLAHYALTPVSVSGHSDLAQPAGVEHFKTRIDFAVALGVTIINTGTGHTVSPADEARFFAHMTETIIPYAAARGVKIALETHGGLTGTAEDCWQTLQKLDSAWVGINYDPANVLYYRGVRPEIDLHKIAPHVIHFHLKDQHGGQNVDDFPPLGEGDIDFAVLVDELRQVNYTGPFSIELETKGINDPATEDEIRRNCRQFTEKLIR